MCTMGSILWIFGFIFLFLLCYALVEVIRILRSVRLMTERIEMLTDVRGWFELFKKWTWKKK